jgi:hypothetical protein
MSPAEEEVPLKEIRERLRDDLPLPEWITNIIGHDVRVEQLIAGDNEPGLGLYFRCEWCNPYDEVTGRTWETEITFGDDSDILNDYIKRHNKSLWTAIDRALENNDGLEMEGLTMRYMLRITGDITKAKQAKATSDSQRKAKEASSAIEPDDDEAPDDDDDVPEECNTQASTQMLGDRSKADLDAMYAAAGGAKIHPKSSSQSSGTKRKSDPDVEAPRVRPQTVDTITIKCGTRAMKFDVAANGVLVMSVDELAHAMGVTADADVLLYTGRYMADRQANHFVVSQDVLNTECALTLTGRVDPDAAEEKPPDANEETTTYKSPLPDGTANIFSKSHLNVNTHAQSDARTNVHLILVYRRRSDG